MAKPRKSVCVGRYKMGGEHVRIFLEPGADGAWLPHGTEDHDEPCLLIGADTDEWREVFATFVHEAFEGSIVRAGGHYPHPTAATCNDTSMCLMVMDHAKFSQASSTAACVIRLASTDIYKAWKKWRADGKR